MLQQDEIGTVVFHNGAVFRADAARSFASAVAVVDGRIAAVGGDAEVADYRAEADDVVDLAGGLLLPGFIDGHVHPIVGGIEQARCDLSTADNLADYRRLIAEYATAHPERPWILGGGWAMSAFPNGLPSLTMLDDVTGGRPTLLPNRDHHSAWANSRALELAGITGATPDPTDGRIERDAEGEPTGLLHEGAAALVERVVPPNTQADYDEGLRGAQKYLHSLGIIGWQDAIVDAPADGPGPHAAYLRAADEGWLTARVAGALWWDRRCAQSDIDEQISRLAKFRAESAGNYQAGTIKIMQDGVAETFTAALLEPYLDKCGHPTRNDGISFLAPELLTAVVTALDSAGFQCHFHALGDRAVREVLDALAATRRANGSSDRRHQLAHLQLVHPDDISRFRPLGAVANLQALWACHEEQMDEHTIPYLGHERADWQYPFGDLFRDGVTLAMGSDWPVSSPDPLLAIQTAVTRIAPNAPTGTPPLSARQTLPLSAALAAYTAGSAFATHLDDRSGTIAVGHRADLVVLDRDPFAHPVDEIAQARVLRTYADGRLVHQA